MSEATTHDPIVSVAAAASELGVSRQTLWRMHALYKLIEPPSRVSPGRVGYRRSVLDRYKASIGEKAS